jgi:hypothetical protein
MLLEHSTFFDTIKIKVLKKLHTLCSSRQISGNVTDMVHSNAKTFIQLMKNYIIKHVFVNCHTKGAIQMLHILFPATITAPLPACKPHAPQKNQPRRIYLSYPAGQPSSATSGTVLFSDSHEGLVHMLYGETSAPALAPKLHTAAK